jgi:hypothetical protein
MAESELLGIIGAVTGVVGSVLGYVGYRQSGQMKSLDLRLQLGQAENEVKISLDHLPALMNFAKQSRTNVTSFNGQTGALQAWNNSHEDDVRTAAVIAVDLALVTKGDYGSLTAAALLEKVVKLHELNLKISRLVGKYKSSLAEDDRARQERRAAMLERLG